MVRISDLRLRAIEGEGSISGVLDELAGYEVAERRSSGTAIAFLTFAFDIDGVSMEIAKYARCFEELIPGATIHCIAGNFRAGADTILDPQWHRHRLDGADGWDKWDGGVWFAKLFYEDLLPDSEHTSVLATEIWRQAIELAERLEAYVEEHGIGLLFPVNTNSNPGNLAFALAIVLVSVVTGLPVINNNHDFYWEGGKEGCKRGLDEPRGPRDHFFRNHDNEEFFGLFQRLFPWNGRSWLQVNINPVQARRLIDRFHFRPEHVHTIGTALAQEFFESADPHQKGDGRARMAAVLGGDPTITPEAIGDFRATADEWLADQRPVVCGSRSGLTLDITGPEALYVLQPTRVVDRKRIWRDLDLIDALFAHPAFGDVFATRGDLSLTLHVTGPVPVEHGPCLERILDRYQSLVASLPGSTAERVFLAFSVGRQNAPGIDPLSMVDIYQLADLVAFPSLTEGRGLPIPESAAAGVPIICSPYHPRPVFNQVIGQHLRADQRIEFLEFPEHEFSDELLERVASLLLDPAAASELIEHNRIAVKGRYSMSALVKSFAEVLAAMDFPTAID